MDTIKRVGLLTIGMVLAACGGGTGDGGSGAPDAQVVPDAMQIPDATPIPDSPLMPSTLRETGLYADFDSGVFAPGVREFRPVAELWSDGAAKRRWMYLPPGSQIDTSDMDYWRYPVGTKLWKEFRRDGVRVETRMLYKIRAGQGVGSWFMRAYVWNAEQTEAVERRGGQDNVLGTDHDVPSELECLQCHGNVPDVALGFSAVAIDYANEGVTLDALVAEGALSHPPAGPGPVYFPVPGAPVDRNALLYLHINCSGCHNPTSEIFNSGDAIQNLRLNVNSLGSVEQTPAFATSVCQATQKDIAGADQIITPGDPDASAMFLRMNLRGVEEQMPKIGTELVDPVGIDAVRVWINAIQSCPQ